VVGIDPFDVAGQAEALHAALSLDGRERQVRAESIRAHVREHDIMEWLDLQLSDLDRVSALT
jgi:trehalose-6-phosphate synthase